MCNTYTILSISLPADCSETSTHYIFVQLNKSNYYDLSKLSTQVTSYQLLEGQLNLSIRVSAGDIARTWSHLVILGPPNRGYVWLLCKSEISFPQAIYEYVRIGWKYFKVTAAVFLYVWIVNCPCTPAKWCENQHKSGLPYLISKHKYVSQSF